MRTEAPNLATTEPAWRSWAIPRRLAAGVIALVGLAGLIVLIGPPLVAAGYARSAADLAAGPYDPARLARADEQIAAALRWRPGDPALLRAQAHIATMRNNPRQAIPLLEAAIAANPAGRVDRIELAEAHEMAGEHARAAAIWRDLGMSQRYAINRGVADLMAQQDAQAQRWFLRAVALGADDPTLAEVRGLLDTVITRRLRGDARRLELLKIAGLLAPEQRLVRYKLGESYLAVGDWRAAYATFRQGLQSTEGVVGQSNFYFQMGWIWHHRADTRDLAAAWADYEQAVLLSDFRRDRWQIAAVYYNRALIRVAQRRWEEALAEEQLALAANPDHYFANLDMALILTALERPAEALPYAQRAVAIDPARAVGHSHLGEIAAALGDMALARSAFERALALDPTLEVARRGLEGLQR